MSARLRGIIAAIPTPFDQAEDLQLGALISNLERWNETPLSGYTVLGTTGEFVSLETEEKKRVLEAARRAIPADKILIAGTGAESTRSTLELTRWAGEIGADFAIVITPHYNRRSFSPEDLVEHYQRVADASPVPILVYHIPACTGISLAPETVAAISEHRNVAGIKDSSGDVLALQEMTHLCRDDFAVLTGSAQVLHAALTVGAKGAILADACCAYDASVELHRALERSDPERARALQAKLIPFSRLLVGRYGIPGVKALLDRMGYYGGPPRRPLHPLGEEGGAQLERALAALETS